MTESPPDITRSSIKRIWTFLHELSKIVFDVKTNFEWLRINNASHINLLDADVIYGALPRFSATVAVQDTLRKSDTEFEIENLIGPLTVRNYLSTIESYCLPLGSYIEVERKLNQLNFETTQHASKLKSDFDALKTKMSFAKIRRRYSEKNLSAVIKTRLMQIAQKAEEVDLVENLIDRATDIDELIGHEDDSKAEEAYHNMLNTLSTERPDRSVSNYCDALNAGTVVQVFNQNAQKSGAFRLPVLISTTKSILKSEQILSNQLQLRDEFSKRPLVVSNERYLFISQNLINYVGANRLTVIVDYMERMQQDIQNLATFCTQFLKGTNSTQQSDEDAIVDMDRTDQDYLRDLMNRFSREWKHLLSPHIRTRDLDRVRLINQLFSPEIERKLDSYKSTEVQKAAEILQERLRNQVGYDRNFWQEIESFSICTHSNSPASNPKRSIFQLSVVEPDGTPLTLCKPAEPFEHAGLTNINSLGEPHEIRILAHTTLKFGGAAFALDTWRNASKSQLRWVRLTWHHTEDLVKIMEIGLNAVSRIAQKNVDSDIRIEVKICSEEKVETILISPTENLRNVFKDREGVTYIEMRLDSYIWFADITLLENVELQAGLVFPASKRIYHEEAFLDSLTSSHSQFRSPNIWRELFTQLETFFNDVESESSEQSTSI